MARIVSPKNTRSDVIDTLNREINAILASPETKVQLANLGGSVFAGSAADFGMFITEEVKKWGEVVRAAHIQSD